MLNVFASGFAPIIQEYLHFRSAFGLGNEHARHLLKFDQYCCLHHPLQTTLTEEIVRGWFLDEITRDRGSLEYKASAIRLFARYIGKSAYILPTSYVPKTPQFHPNILTKKELSAFFLAVDSCQIPNDTFLPVVMSVLLRLMYACGLRPGEARNLRLRDVDSDSGEITILKSKKNADRIVVASDGMLALLNEYILKRTILSVKSEYLFVHTNSNPITYMELWDYVRKCWRKANPGVEDLPAFRPYDLRHRYASTVLQNWMDDGKDIYIMMPYLRAYMGHVRFEDTLYYIHILPDRLLASKSIDWNRVDEVKLEASIWTSN